MACYLCRGEEHTVQYSYDADKSVGSIHDRTVEPLLQKFVEGYNAAAILFGATGL